MATEAMELATVYLSVVPSFDSLEGKVGSMFGAPLGREAEKAGSESGKKFSDKFGSAAKMGVAAAGLAVGGGIMAGVNSAIEKDSAGNKLTAQLALTPEQSARYGKLAGDLYSANYGDSMGSVNDALKSVTQNIGGMGTASDKELSSITAKVMSTASAFDQDLGGVTTATGVLMKNGLAKDANEALDIITKGLQTNGGSADDLIDTFTEYSPLFKALGADGSQGLGMINQMMAAGARNTDVAADALKEFQIRATDGSKSSATAYEALGLNAQKMTAQMAKGGPEASAGLQTVMEKLRAMKDPVERNAAAVGLFGTKAEDLGAALFAIDPSKAKSGLGEVAGAASKVDETLSKGTGPALESLKRGMEGAFGGMLQSVLPILQPLIGFLTQFAPVLGPIALGLMAVAAAQWVWNAAQLANPLTWIILGIVALVAGIVWLIANWDKASKFIVDVFKPVGDFFKSMWDGIAFGAKLLWEGILALVKGFVDGVVWLFQNGTLLGIIISNWDAIFATTQQVFGAIGQFFANMWGTITLGFNTAVNFIVGIWQNFSDMFILGVNTFVGWWNGLWAGFGSLVSDIWNNLIAGIMTIWTTYVGWVTGAWGAFTALWQGFWNGIFEFVTGIWNTVVTNMTEFFTKMINNFTTGITKIWDFLSGMGEKIIGFFDGMVSTAADFGRNIIEGIINGVKSMGSTLMDVFGDLLPDWVTGPFADALGIHSPSRVFKVMGENTGQGFVIGADSQEAAIKKSMANIAQPPAMPKSSMAPATLASEARPAENFQMDVHPSAGMDEIELAELVARRVSKMKRR